MQGNEGNRTDAVCYKNASDTQQQQYAERINITELASRVSNPKRSAPHAETKNQPNTKKVMAVQDSQSRF
jgi:hypothetical protein